MIVVIFSLSQVLNAHVQNAQPLNPHHTSPSGTEEALAWGPKKYSFYHQ